MNYRTTQQTNQPPYIAKIYYDDPIIQNVPEQVYQGNLTSLDVARRAGDWAESVVGEQPAKLIVTQEGRQDPVLEYPLNKNAGW